MRIRHVIQLLLIFVFYGCSPESNAVPVEGLHANWK